MTMKKLSCSSGLTGHLVPVKAYAQTRQRLRFSHTQSIDEDEGSDLRVYLASGPAGNVSVAFAHMR